MSNRLNDDFGDGSTDGSNGINRSILSDQVKQYILEAIESGQLAPGERLIELQLARRLRISQAPVREAIRDLVSSGFLVRESHKGTMVRKLTDEDMQEIYTVRAPLDALAAEQAAPHITGEQIRSLRKLLDQMMQTAKEGNFLSTARLDWQFHMMIVGISGNKLLRRIYDNMQLGQFVLVTMHRSKLGLEELAARHLQIIEALETRDPEVAGTVTRRHIEELDRPVIHANAQ